MINKIHTHHHLCSLMELTRSTCRNYLVLLLDYRWPEGFRPHCRKIYLPCCGLSEWFDLDDQIPSG